MKTRQQGFTLIELVVVIVLLGIIGAVATARFQDLGTAAADAVEEGVASEMASASAINYGVAVSGGAAAVNISGAAVDCAALAPQLMQAGAVPAGITITNGADTNCGGAGNTVTCTVTHDDGSAGDNATATLLCSG